MHWISRWSRRQWTDRYMHVHRDRCGRHKEKTRKWHTDIHIQQEHKNCTCTHKQVHMWTCTHCFQHNACSVVTCILWPTSYKWINITAFPGISFVCVCVYDSSTLHKGSQKQEVWARKWKSSTVRFRFIQIVIHASLGFMLILKKKKGKKWKCSNEAG